jgi:hypothetical protein
MQEKNHLRPEARHEKAEEHASKSGTETQLLKS